MVALDSERIDSWKDISAYLGRDVSTVIRWEKEKGLPVHRIPGGQRHGVFAYRRELDNWLAGSDKVAVVALPASNGRATNQLPEMLEAQELGPSPSPIAVPGKSLAGKVPHWKRAIYSAVGFVAALLVMVAAHGVIESFLPGRALQLANGEQLTANGLEKDGLLTDGRNIYFGQEQNGHFALASIPVGGGPVRVLWSPTENVLPASISPDGQKLVVMTSVGVERECSLWIVPLDSEQPRRLLNIRAHAGVWAPDNKTVAYASGNGIFLAPEDGTVPRQIASFTEFPYGLSWSEDGTRLRFFLEDISTGNTTKWGWASGAEMKAITLDPLPPPLNTNAVLNPAGLVGWGSHAPAELTAAAENVPVWLLRFGRSRWEPAFQAVPIGSLSGGLQAVATSSDFSRLLALSEPRTRFTFISFNAQARSFRGILPGVSGKFLDYSRDGKWVAYASDADRNLWVSKADGSSARQLTSSFLCVELPHWSPDGSRIAYTAQSVNRPWRIYVLRLSDGSTREASEGNDSQGAPTWSPDGRFLVYGNVRCEPTNSCAIRRIDLATGKVQTLPDSDGLVTARWSPDGRFIAALHLEQHKLMLFDVKTSRWREQAEGIDGADLNWSRDSKCIYAAVHGTGAGVVRIPISTGQRETALDIHAQDKLDLAEVDDLQFSLAPDDSVILHRGIHSEEIYTYEIRKP